jgi:hypothetical protein
LKKSVARFILLSLTVTLICIFSIPSMIFAITDLGGTPNAFTDSTINSIDKSVFLKKTTLTDFGIINCKQDLDFIYMSNSSKENNNTGNSNIDILGDNNIIWTGTFGLLAKQVLNIVSQLPTVGQILDIIGKKYELNWCGETISGGKIIKKGDLGDTNVKPVNWFDWWAMEHDKDYYSAEQEANPFKKILRFGLLTAKVVIGVSTELILRSNPVGQKIIDSLDKRQYGRSYKLGYIETKGSDISSNQIADNGSKTSCSIKVMISMIKDLYQLEIYPSTGGNTADLTYEIWTDGPTMHLIDSGEVPANNNWGGYNILVPGLRTIGAGYEVQIILLDKGVKVNSYSVFLDELDKIKCNIRVKSSETIISEETKDAVFTLEIYPSTEGNTTGLTYEIWVDGPMMHIIDSGLVPANNNWRGYKIKYHDSGYIWTGYEVKITLLDNGIEIKSYKIFLK